MGFLVFFLTFILVFKNDRQHTVSPFFGFSIASEKLININSLRIQCIELSVFTVALVSLDQGFPDSRLSTTRRTNDEHAMSDIKNFIKIYAFFDELLFRNETHNVFSNFLANFCQFWWLFIFGFSIWEKIFNESDEDRLIVSNNLWNIKISQGSLQKRIFLHFFVFRVSLQFTSLS